MRFSLRVAIGLAILGMSLILETAEAQTPMPTPILREAQSSSFLPEEVVCSSNAGCKAPMRCSGPSERNGSPTGKRCIRYWNLWDSPVIKDIACNGRDSCGLSYRCIKWVASDLTDISQCGHLPDFVWPIGTVNPRTDLEVPVLSEPPDFASGAPIPPNFPKTWDIRTGPLPPAPKGYMWTSGLVRADPCGHCGTLCGSRLERNAKKRPTDFKFRYSIGRANWMCLTYSSHTP